MKTSVALLLALVMLLLNFTVYAATEAEPEKKLTFLKTQGEEIFNEAGERVMLHGTNFGGWGIMEDWFCP